MESRTDLCRRRLSQVSYRRPRASVTPCARACCAGARPPPLLRRAGGRGGGADVPLGDPRPDRLLHNAPQARRAALRPAAGPRRRLRPPLPKRNRLQYQAGRPASRASPKRTLILTNARNDATHILTN
eukprot:4159181-Pleurochrysis_carterae.AAC.2